MNLFLRFFTVIFAAFLRKRLHPLDESVVTFRVWLNDIDMNGHMNNGRYLAMMDLGSLDMMLRAGIAKPFLRHKWRPIVASVMIRFKHELKPFETYQLHTRVLCWDQKWFFMEQRFEQEGAIIAVGLVKGLFRGPLGNVAPMEVFAALGHNITSPPIPESVAIWLQSETLMGYG